MRLTSCYLTLEHWRKWNANWAKNLIFRLHHPHSVKLLKLFKSERLKSWSDHSVYRNSSQCGSRQKVTLEKACDAHEWHWPAVMSRACMRCLTYWSTALAQEHTRDSKNNSWIHIGLFPEEECLRSPLWVAIQVLIWHYEPSTPLLIQRFAPCTVIYLTQQTHWLHISA